MRAVLILVAISLTAPATEAKQHRSTKTKHVFQKANPWPATGFQKGKCPGYIIDHVVPLCAGGLDAPSNLQWQTVADARVKDKAEWKQCRLIRNNQ